MGRPSWRMRQSREPSLWQGISTRRGTLFVQSAENWKRKGISPSGGDGMQRQSGASSRRRRESEEAKAATLLEWQNIDFERAPGLSSPAESSLDKLSELFQ